MIRGIKYFLSLSFLILTLTACSEAEDKDAYLSGIRLSFGELDFEPRTKTYSLAVTYATTDIDITAYPAYKGLYSYIDGQNASSPVNVELNIGENTVIIDLQGAGFIPTVYTLTFIRADATGSPVITRLGEDPVTHTQGVEYIDAGATALDAEDGDITALIVDSLTENPIDINAPDTYTITYDVTDSEGFSAITVTRTVNVVVNTEPVITLLGNATETIALNSVYIDAGATAYDAEEGDLSADIDPISLVDTNVAGTYIITYDVTDAGGLSAAQVTRTVIVAP